MKRLVALDRAGEDEENPTLDYVVGKGRGEYCLLDVGQAAVLAPGEAVTADLSNILLGEDSFLLSEQDLLKPTCDRPSLSTLKAVRVHRGVRKGQYPSLLRRMPTSGMVVFLPLGPNVIENSVFGVWKEPHVSQRLIWGGERCNLLFNPDANAVDLPSPDVLCGMRLPPGSHLHISGCDVLQYYNKLRAPDFLVPFFGLHRARASGLGISSTVNFVVPCLRCIPMGTTFAVSLAQRATVAIMRRAGLCKSMVVSGAVRTLRGGMGSQMPYIDDCNSVGTSAAGVNKATERVIEELDRAGLPVAPKKTHWAGSGAPGSALGLWWWPEGILTPRPAMVRRLRCGSEKILRAGGGPTSQVQRLVGSWVWCCLLRCGALSIMSALFEICSSDSVNPASFTRLNAEQLLELDALLGIMPLLHADLSLQPSSRLYASDASPSGAGVVYSDLPLESMERALKVFSETRVTSGWYSYLFLPGGSRDTLAAGSSRDRSTSSRVSRPFSNLVSGCSFRVAISSAWSDRSPHINILEMEAVKLALRHMGKGCITPDLRVPLLVDNTGVLGALGKGRSSSRVLNRLCRQVFAIAALQGTVLELHWVSSTLNPANGRSRRAHRSLARLRFSRAAR